MTSTAIAAAAMAALTASQGPGLEFVQPGGRDAGTSPEASDLPADGNSPYHTELPPLVKPDKPDASKDLPDVSGPSESGIPATVLAAYKKAERALAGERPGCNLSWQLLAAIGKVESGQARGGAVDSEGTTLKPILGPALNGVGFAHISDTDGGAYDGDTRYDRAVGPMQFIPSTWASWGADGNGDGRKDPNNIYDAALAAGRYLCAGGRDLSNRADLERAILSYNQSREYLRTVLSWLEFYRKGAHEVPDGKGVLPESPGAGNESRPAQPSTDPDSRSKGGNGGSGNGKDGQGGQDGKDQDGEGGKGEDDGKDPSPRPTVSESGSVQPKPTKTPTPLPTGPGIPTPTEKPTKPGEPTTSPTPTPTPTCPTDPEPEPTDSDEPTEPTPTPTPTPTGTDGAEEPDEPGEPGDPEDPCGAPEGEDGEEGKGEDDGKKEPAPAPSASGSVSGVLGRSGE